MGKRRALASSAAVGWIITALAVLLIAPLAVPEADRTEYFWYRVAWTEVLCLLCWGSLCIYLAAPSSPSDSRSRFGGIVPSVCAITGGYALLSFAAMLVHAFTSSTDTSDRAHSIVQVVLLASAGVCVALLSITRAAATSGLALGGTGLPSPQQLHDRLAMLESAIRETRRGREARELAHEIKSLREAIQYSLSECSSLSQSTDYSDLCSQLQGLCDGTVAEDGVSPREADELSARIACVTRLRSVVQHLAAQQIKR